MSESADPVEAIKAIYGATLRGKAHDGKAIPQWGYFDREGVGALLARIEDLEAAVRRHRDYRGDDRCHADDGELYRALPEGDTRPARETAVTLENCARYIECRQTGREYVSPQRRIEELEAEVAALRTRPAARRPEPSDRCGSCGHVLSRHTACGEGLCLDCDCGGWEPKGVVERA